MRGIAASLSEQDMADLAAYYGVPAGTAQARGDAESGKAKVAQVCAACHGPDGNRPSTPDQPILAGQYADYFGKPRHASTPASATNPSTQGSRRQPPNRATKDV